MINWVLAKQLKEEGRSSKEIAVIMGCSYCSISKRFPAKIKPIDENKVCKMKMEGIKVGEIAEELGFSYSYIRSVLQKNDVILSPLLMEVRDRAVESIVLKMLIYKNKGGYFQIQTNGKKGIMPMEKAKTYFAEDKFKETFAQNNIPVYTIKYDKMDINVPFYLIDRFIAEVKEIIEMYEED